MREPSSQTVTVAYAWLSVQDRACKTFMHAGCGGLPGDAGAAE